MLQILIELSNETKQAKSVFIKCQSNPIIGSEESRQLFIIFNFSLLLSIKSLFSNLYKFKDPLPPKETNIFFSFGKNFAPQNLFFL